MKAEKSLLPVRRSCRDLFLSFLLSVMVLANFALELDAELLFDRCAGGLDQRFDVGRARIAGVDDEIRVLGRNHRAAERTAFEPAGFDQACRVVCVRVAEYRAGVGLARLCRAMRLHRLVLDYRAISRLADGSLKCAATNRSSEGMRDERRRRMKDEG